MSSFTPSAELRFVFRAADPRCTADDLLAIAAQIEDWERVARLAETEGATAVLYRLVKPAAARLPAQFMTFLQARTMIADFRMQRLAARAWETVAALEAARIPVVLLKGAAVGAMFDPTFRLRPMTDVDVLIRESDAARAHATVMACGWQPMQEARVLELFVGHQHLPPYLDATLEGLRLELHTALLPPDSSFALSAEELRASAVQPSVEFAGARVPDPARLLVHTAVHFAWQHEMQFAPWRTLRTVALLTQARDWDWEAFVAVARAAMAHTCSFWTLRMGHMLAGLDVPASVLSALAPPTVEPLRAMLDRHFASLADPLERPRSPSERVTRLMWRLALRPRWSGLRRSDRNDPERRWERAMGTLQEQGRLSTVQRHIGARQAWWAYLSRTIVGR